MQTLSTERSRAENLSGEFIPPLSLGEIGMLPWDRQLDAALAWQEAGGNADDAADLMLSRADRQLPTMRTITRMNTVLIGLGQRLQQVQLEAANVAIGEMAQRERAATSALNPEDAFSPLQPDNLERIQALAASCLDLLTAARLNLTGVPGFVPSGQRASGGEGATVQPGVVVERRKRAMMIDFPDRRAAA